MERDRNLLRTTDSSDGLNHHPGRKRHLHPRLRDLTAGGCSGGGFVLVHAPSFTRTPEPGFPGHNGCQKPALCCTNHGKTLGTASGQLGSWSFSTSIFPWEPPGEEQLLPRWGKVFGCPARASLLMGQGIPSPWRLRDQLSVALEVPGSPGPSELSKLPMEQDALHALLELRTDSCCPFRSIHELNVLRVSRESREATGSQLKCSETWVHGERGSKKAPSRRAPGARECKRWERAMGKVIPREQWRCIWQREPLAF